MPNVFLQHTWGQWTEIELQRLLEIALMEDSENFGDITSTALIEPSMRGTAAVVARQGGILAGIPVISAVLKAVSRQLSVQFSAADGETVVEGKKIAEIAGPAAAILSAERLILNFISRLSGIATLTERYVDTVAGTNVRIYDTRKTTPGWRRLEKYAVLCGGGTNHRSGLYDAVLIKDNHIALLGGTAAEAVRKARDFINFHFSRPMPVEVEVDTLQQLKDVLPAEPDLVLLDNMTLPQLREAVQIRDTIAPQIELEASGGINLATVRSVAETGVERISVGALTHSAVSLDFGLDWQHSGNI